MWIWKSSNFVHVYDDVYIELISVLTISKECHTTEIGRVLCLTQTVLNDRFDFIPQSGENQHALLTYDIAYWAVVMR